MEAKRVKTLETRPLTAAEEEEVLRQHGVASIDEIPADADIVVGDWDGILADVDRRESEIRQRDER
jgi:hypothetical protein